MVFSVHNFACLPQSVIDDTHDKEQKVGQHYNDMFIVRSSYMWDTKSALCEWVSLGRGDEAARRVE